MSRKARPFFGIGNIQGEEPGNSVECRAHDEAVPFRRREAGAKDQIGPRKALQSPWGVTGKGTPSQHGLMFLLPKLHCFERRQRRCFRALIATARIAWRSPSAGRGGG